MVHQEIHIYSIQKELSDIKKQMLKTTNEFLSITNLEYIAIEVKLNEVINKQQEILLMETICYAQNIELLFGRLKATGFQVVNIKTGRQTKLRSLNSHQCSKQQRN
ncbi:hypothetical protein ACFFRR_005465 [Megaselia abdita]